MTAAMPMPFVLVEGDYRDPDAPDLILVLLVASRFSRHNWSDGEFTVDAEPMPPKHPALSIAEA
jgi:hypothetical protein